MRRGARPERGRGLAVFGLVCLAVGFVFPPGAVVGAVALELSEAALVAGVAVDVAVALDHPTQDNWVTVGGDALAIATGYAVGKVIIGPALGALGRKLAQREALAAEAAAAKAAADKLAAEQATVRETSSLNSRVVTDAEAAEIHALKENLLQDNPELRPSMNVATATGNIDGKTVDLRANSSKAAGKGTVPHKLFRDQQLKTRPTESDLVKGRSHEALRAYDSEVKMLEKVLDDTTPASEGEIAITSLNDFCNSRGNAIDVQMKVLRPGIK